MNDSVSVVCDQCGARFRVKPNAYKIMKTLKCTKCGHLVPLTKPIVEASPPPPAPAPVPPAPEAEPKQDVAVVEKVTEKADATPTDTEKIAALELEIDRLREKLKASELEIAESDARIASLQELWHSKELEAREMSARATKAETEARQARAIRDAFLARAKSELAHYLVGERDAALTRFAELEKKLQAINPEG
ncbi:MAG TPA: hypothetical protein PJ991_10495 [Kiritimatiellia bacterium]|nr:hypothetical protein [Kiritimatiellia bacterium]